MYQCYPIEVSFTSISLGWFSILLYDNEWLRFSKTSGIQFDSKLHWFM